MENSLLGQISLCIQQLIEYTLNCVILNLDLFYPTWMVRWLAHLLYTETEYTLSCVIRVEVSFRWICILPKVVILAGMEYQSQSDLATVVITKPMHASETELCHWPPYSNWELSLKRQDALPLMTMGKQCGLDIETKIQT